jgi:hypothetical protein
MAGMLCLVPGRVWIVDAQSRLSLARKITRPTYRYCYKSSSDIHARLDKRGYWLFVQYRPTAYSRIVLGQITDYTCPNTEGRLNSWLFLMDTLVKNKYPELIMLYIEIKWGYALQLPV